ncbi:MAG: hypothetical protein PUC30_05380 [Lachnospiraceae bacterium]|nr:hypothetical protein [Lachnospiraceae bacterium]
MAKRKELPINGSPLTAYMEEAYPLSVALTDVGVTQMGRFLKRNAGEVTHP